MIQTTLKVTATEISLPRNYLDYYETIASQPFPFLLDSGGYNLWLKNQKLENPNPSRYTFMGSNPFLVLSSKGDKTQLLENERATTKKGNPFDILQNILAQYRLAENTTGIPFSCGCVGYFGYDLCHYIEKLPATAKDDLPFPELSLAFYDRIICIDHLTGKNYIVELNHRSQKRAKGQRAKSKEQRTTGRLRRDITSNFTKPDYISAIKKTKEYIMAGDIYQVSISQRFHTKTNLPAIDILKNLQKVSPSPYSAIIELENGQMVISSSPELFLQTTGDKIITRPIKGTRRRGKTAEEDNRLKEELLSSEKDTAELTMIIDLERNDLGKVCEYGSVNVTELKTLETHPTVHHLVSTVEGKLKQGITNADILKATFPGGSVTGAPKIRAMEIIDELEPTRRNAYTGAIGYVGFDGSMMMSMAIRIMLKNGRDVYFQTGGAIVADSAPEKEYEETLVKAEGIIQSIK